MGRGEGSGVRARKGEVGRKERWKGKLRGRWDGGGTANASCKIK